MQAKPLSPELGLVLSGSASDAPPTSEETLKLLARHGVVLVRGTAADKEAFLEWTRSVAPGLPRGVVDDNVGLDFHGEGYYLPYRIDVLWFYCIVAPTHGGETKFVDGVAVWRALGASAREYFESHPLSYELTLPQSLWTPLLKFLDVGRRDPGDPFYLPLTSEAAAAAFGELGLPCVVSESGALFGRYQHRAASETRFGGEDAFVNTLLHAVDPIFIPRQNYRLTTVIPSDILAEVKRTTERLAVLVQWRERDMVAVDNTRVMHGRLPFQGPRQILAVNGRFVTEQTLSVPSRANV